MKTKEYPTKSEIEHLFEYKEGVLFWTDKANRRVKGKIAGCTNKKGYKTVNINKKRFYVHRLVWILFYGNIDKELSINHKDCNTSNNRIENLELVTHRENDQKKKIHISGKLIGATYDKENKRWLSRIFKDGKQRHLGSFMTKEEAHNAYKKELDLILKKD